MRSGSYTMRRPRSTTGTCLPWFPIRFPTGTASHWQRTALYLTVKMLVLFLAQLAVIILWSRKARNIILDSKEALELEKKKLELALLHSTGTTFEYVPKDDSLSFISPPVVKEVEFPTVLNQISRRGRCGTGGRRGSGKMEDDLKEDCRGKEPGPLELRAEPPFRRTRISGCP